MAYNWQKPTFCQKKWTCKYCVFPLSLSSSPVPSLSHVCIICLCLWAHSQPFRLRVISKKPNNISVRISTGGDQFKLFDVLFYNAVFFPLICIASEYKWDFRQKPFLQSTPRTTTNSRRHLAMAGVFVYAWNHVLTTPHTHIDDNSIYMKCEKFAWKILFVINFEM